MMNRTKRIAKQANRSRQLMEGKEARKSVLFVLVFAASFIYILWRLFFTLPLHHGVISMICGVTLWLCESVTVLETFTHFRNARHVKIPEMPTITADMYPDVDVLIATHNEPEELLFKTINGCKYMKYPDKRKVHIYLCDDTDRASMRKLAQQMGIGYFGFRDNKYAKAGNLNYALPRTSSPLIAVFDADMIPTSNFLLETVPYFFRRDMILENGRWRMRTREDGESSEKELGYVQTQQSFYNPDPLQRNLYLEDSVPNEQDYFYRSVNVARMRTDSAAFAGSNALFSRKALEDVGGLATHSITEDFATGIAILGKGYRSIAVDKELAHGLSPEDVISFIKQRQRWSRGAAQGVVTRKFWFSGLKARAKWNFFVSYLYWWTFVRRFVFILCPILYGLFGVQVADVTFWQLMAIWLPYYIIYNNGLRVMSGKTTNFQWSDRIDTIQFPYMMWPIIAGTLKIPQTKFWVTPKDRQTGKNSSIRLAIPHIILAALSYVTIMVCSGDVFILGKSGSIIVLFWALYNAYTLFHAIVYYMGRSNNRYYERIPTPIPVTLHPDHREITGVTADLSEGGMAVLLDTPEYLPYDSEFEIEAAYMDYKARMKVRVRQIQQLEDKWKYGLEIVRISQEDRQEYLQILYDRNHFFPRMIDIGVFKDIPRILRGVTRPHRAEQRLLPRINVNTNVNTLEAGPVEIIDFNYQYTMLSASRDLPDRLTLQMDKDIKITCVRDSEVNKNRQGANPLYLIEDWKTLAADLDFRECLYHTFGLTSNEVNVDSQVGALTAVH